jgi:hypothetical protein
MLNKESIISIKRRTLNIWQKNIENPSISFEFGVDFPTYNL